MEPYKIMIGGILIRTCGSKKRGIGHLTRCQSIAQAAEQLDIPVCFLLDKESKSLALERHDWNSSIKEVANHKSVDLEAQQIVAEAKMRQSKLIVIDGYDYSPELITSLKNQLNEKVLVLDDGGENLVSHADFIVNPAADDEMIARYQLISPTAKLYTGGMYRLLRREFCLVQPNDMSHRHGIVISMGGSDPQNITIPILAALNNHAIHYPVRVVTGAAYPFLDELKQEIANSNFAVQHIHNCQDMAEIWNHAELAVSAAGGSQFELGVCSTPSLLVSVAQNQYAATKLASEEQWCEVFSHTDSYLISSLVERIEYLMSHPKRLVEMSNATAGLYSADGAVRLLTDVWSQLYD